jgi:hypothetical protein
LVVQFYEGGPSVHYDKRELRGRLFLAVAAIAGSNKWARRLRQCPTCDSVVEADIDRIGARLLLRRPRKSRKEQHRIGSAAITVVIGMPGQPAGPDPILQPRKKVKRMRNASSRLH